MSTPEGKSILQSTIVFHQPLQPFHRSEFGAMVRRHGFKFEAKGLTC